MEKIKSTHFRILAIAPSSRGFGFAVLEGHQTLVDWGVKSVTGDKNTDTVAKVEAMISHYQPGTLVLENPSTTHSRRSERIRLLGTRIIAAAEKHHVSVAVLSREQVRKQFFANGEGTKHALAELLAGLFPDELASRLPPKRRPWMSEDYRMDIFDAVALALALRLKKVGKLLGTLPGKARMLKPSVRD